MRVIDALVKNDGNKPLNAFEVIILQNYIDGVFRLLILVLFLAISIITFNKERIGIVVIGSVCILLTIAYAYYTLVTVGSVLTTIPEYDSWNIIFYYILTTLLLIICIMTLYFHHFKKSKIPKKNYEWSEIDY